MDERIFERKISFLPLFIFAVAMGFLEAIVVVYVRELYYPNGFEFPLKVLPPRIVAIEIIREFSTMLMLGAVAFLTGKTFVRRLSVFIFIFGIWDIVYYIALKIFLDWPESLLTWDILFLIPITWVSPVLAPVICSVVMIAMAVTFENLQRKKMLHRFKWTELFLIFLGAAIILFTFVYDFGKIILKGGFLSNYFTLTENSRFIDILTTYVPADYQWEIFTIGIFVILAGVYLIVKRTKRTKNS